MSKTSQDRIIKFIKYWLPAIMWAAVIFSFSSNPTGRASEIHWEDFLIKKSGHIFVYSVLTIFLYRAFFNYRFGEKLSAKYTFVVNVLYAISDEFHQSFTPGREPTVRDILIDSFAIVTVLYLILKYLPKAPKIVKLWAGRFDLTKK